MKCRSFLVSSLLLPSARLPAISDWSASPRTTCPTYFLGSIFFTLPASPSCG